MPAVREGGGEVDGVTLGPAVAGSACRITSVTLSGGDADVSAGLSLIQLRVVSRDPSHLALD